MSAFPETCFENTAYRRIEVMPLSGALGAEIGGVNLRHAEDEDFEEIYRAWLNFQVIYFRRQEMTPDEHLAFARRWGEIHIHPFNAPMEGYPEILQLLKTENATRNNGNRWHSDQMYTAEPAKATILLAREMPPYGGDTMFSNLYLAYESLSDGMQELLADLKGVHNGNSSKNYIGGSRAAQAKLGLIPTRQKEPDPDIQTVSVHPIVRTHPETGRKALYIGSHTEHFDGMTADESKPLLEYLMAHTSRPEFVCRVRWAVGTLTMWDNRCTQHYALNDYQGQRRCVHKITVKGDTPF
ncbi:MAG: TauD/TfdA family dioxygenase [Pseudomonadota bacterium]|nr:TauD/TfdA family dioxygenase [Pseudomonadota bacterium]